MKAKRIVPIILVLIFALSIMTGCAANTAAQTSDSEDANTAVNTGVISEATAEPTDQAAYVADTIRIAGTDPTNLDPFYGAKSQKSIFFMVYQRLFGMGNDGQLFGVLAKDYEVDSTGLVYTVHLYDGIHDQSGNAFTASDVVFSYQQWKAEGYASNVPKLDIDTGIVAVDDQTVQFTLSGPIENVGELFYYLGNTDCATKAAFDASPSNLASDACGTGRYKITDYTPGVSITLEKDDNFWQTDSTVIHPIDMGNVSKIVYYFVSEDQQKQISLVNDEMDFAPQITYSVASDFMQGGLYSDGFGVDVIASNDIEVMFFNCSSLSPLSDKNLRLAIGYAIDHDMIMAALGAGMGNPLYGLGGSRYADYDPTIWAGRDDFEHNFDTEAAKEMIAASGYNGETIRIMCNSTDNSGTRKTMAQYIAQCLNNVGINTEIMALDSSTEKSNRSDLSAWDIDLMAMHSNDYMVNIWYNYFDYSGSGNTVEGQNWTGIQDDQMIELLSTARHVATFSPENEAAFAEYVIDNAYCYTIGELYLCSVYSTDLIQSLTFAGPQSQYQPGSFTYVNPN